MSFGTFWKNAINGRALHRFHKDVVKPRFAVRNKLSEEDVIAHFIRLIKSEDTIKIVEAYGDEESPVDDPVRAPINELYITLANVIEGISTDTGCLKLAKFIVANKVLLRMANKSPNQMLTNVHIFSFRCQGQTGMELLSILEQDEEFLPHIIKNASNLDYAADFFIQIRTGLDDNLSIVRFRTSPSFQAGGRDRKFIDHLIKKAPKLVEGIVV